MSKALKIGLIVGGILIAIVIGSMWMSAHNKEVEMRNAVTQKQVDNQNQYDNLWKKINQAAQIPPAQVKATKEILSAYVEGRGGVKGAAMFKFLHEAVPNIDTSTFNKLQDIIVSSRDGFTARQRELTDLKREHDNVLQRAPSSWFVGGRPRINIKIVTSAKAEEAFKTGMDNDVKLDL